MSATSGDRALQERARQALNRAKAFVDSIKKAPEAIEGSTEMSVVKNVVDLETGDTGDMILRTITEPFWNACIEAVNTPDLRVRIAAVGTPGIGKTTSTPWLIRMLLEKGHTVVYLIRTEKQTGWFYEFVPNQSNDEVAVEVYPESRTEYAILSLLSPSSYYIVDPGKTKTNCDPGDIFQAKVILVPSPDLRHWGESEFAKKRKKVIGRFRYFPTWSMEELLVARSILGPDMTEDQVRFRFHQFGGVPRHVFALEIDGLAQLLTQKDAVKHLSEKNVTDIVLGIKEPIDGFHQATKSAVLGFRLAPDDRDTFEKGESYIISTLVSETIYSEFQNILWNEMVRLGQDGGGGKIFEMITRHLIANGNPPRRFDGRCCVGRSNIEYYHTFVVLGTGNKAIYQVMDPFEAARTCANVVFHPISSQNPLYDFVYTDSVGHFHVFQATIGASHSANVNAILELEERAGGATKMTLYYLVPSTNFLNFVTDHVEPERVSCAIFHVSIPNPGLEKSLPAELMDGPGGEGIESEQNEVAESEKKVAATASRAVVEGTESEVASKKVAATAPRGTKREQKKGAATQKRPAATAGNSKAKSQAKMKK